MQNEKSRYMITAIKEAIDVLEFRAHQNSYKNDTKHKKLIAYLQNARADLVKRENSSVRK